MIFINENVLNEFKPILYQCRICTENTQNTKRPPTNANSVLDNTSLIDWCTHSRCIVLCTYLSCPCCVALEKSVPAFCDPQQNLFKFQLEIPLKINTALSLPRVILYYLTRRFSPTSPPRSESFVTLKRMYIYVHYRKSKYKHESNMLKKPFYCEHFTVLTELIIVPP